MILDSFIHLLLIERLNRGLFQTLFDDLNSTEKDYKKLHEQITS